MKSKPIFLIIMFLTLTVTALISEVECNLIRQLHVEETVHLRVDKVLDCSKKGEGYFPNDEDCTRFYRCVNESRPGSSTVTVWKRYDFVCGPGSVYDPSEGICVLGNGNGNNSTCQPSNEMTVVTPSGMTPAEENSDSSFKCPEHPPVTSDCPNLKCIVPVCESWTNGCKPDQHCCPYYNEGCQDCLAICYNKTTSSQYKGISFLQKLHSY